MGRKIDRRELLRGAAGWTALPAAAIRSAGPTFLLRQSVRPIVIASANGNRFKNGGAQTCVEKAFTLMNGVADVLDALIAGVNIVELDPEDYSVGYGGLPNAEGVVQLDASCMHGPKRQAGGVAALEGVRTPSEVAKAVMENTDNHLLVGQGAQTFARTMGFSIEADLNTERSRRLWLEWKRHTDPQHYPDPKDRAEAGYQAALDMARSGRIDPEHLYGTINCNGINAGGDLGGVTTTSGLAFKIPGRVGDSPILGAGLYVDNRIGAVGSTGRGEANLYGLCSFLIVEEMRRGRHPKDAGLEALRRVQANTVEKRLRNANGEPDFQLNFYILDAKGRHAAVAMHPGTSYALCTENGAQTLACEPLLPR